MSCVLSIFVLNVGHRRTCRPHYALVPSIQNSVNLSFCISADGKHLPDILGEPTFHICALLDVRKHPIATSINVGSLLIKVFLFFSLILQ